MGSRGHNVTGPGDEHEIWMHRPKSLRPYEGCCVGKYRNPKTLDLQRYLNMQNQTQNTLWGFDLACSGPFVTKEWVFTCSIQSPTKLCHMHCCIMPMFGNRQMWRNLISFDSWSTGSRWGKLVTWCEVQWVTLQNNGCFHITGCVQMGGLWRSILTLPSAPGWTNAGMITRCGACRHCGWDTCQAMDDKLGVDRSNSLSPQICCRPTTGGDGDLEPERSN